jgi:hypothetical protein
MDYSGQQGVQFTLTIPMKEDESAAAQDKA